MLALAPTPVQQHSSTIQYHPSPSATRSSRSSLSRASSSSTAAQSSSSSSSSTVSASSTVRSSHREGPSSPRRTTSSSHPASYSHPASSRANGDSHFHPPSDTSAAIRRSTSDTKGVDIHAYDPQELLRLLASLLAQIATTNDGLAIRDPHLSQSITPPAPPSPVLESHHPPIWRTLTTASRNALSSNMSLTFHARNVPTITLEAYLLRILKYCPASNEVFLSLLVYFDRMSKLAKETCGKDFVIDSYNIHRLVIAGVTVASKFFSDVFYTNSRYAKVGGLPQTELNQLELQFLLLNDFRLMISREEMQRYAEQLIHFSYSHQQQQHRSQVQAQMQSPSPSSAQINRLPNTDVPSPSSPYSLQSSAAYSHAPSGPAKFMSAVDGYRESGDSEYGAAPVSLSLHCVSGHVAGSRTPQVHATRLPSQHGSPLASGPNAQYLQQYSYAPQQQHEGQNQSRAGYRRSSSSYSTISASTEASEAETETDFDGSTDDEPTIRPDAASVRSMSVEGEDEDENVADARSNVEADEDEDEEAVDRRRGRGGRSRDERSGVLTPGERVRGQGPGRSREQREGDEEGDYRMMSP